MYEDDGLDERLKNIESDFQGGIINQFRTVAAEIGQKLFWPCDVAYFQGPAPKARVHFVRWHTDGDLQQGKWAIKNDQVVALLRDSKSQFTTSQIFLTAYSELPPTFTHNMQAFPEDCFATVATEPMACTRTIFNAANLEEHARNTGCLRQAPEGAQIIAFPAGLPHTGSQARSYIPRRTLVAATLTLQRFPTLDR